MVRLACQKRDIAYGYSKPVEFLGRDDATTGAKGLSVATIERCEARLLPFLF
jgi:hypothetical protein